MSLMVTSPNGALSDLSFSLFLEDRGRCRFQIAHTPLTFPPGVYDPGRYKLQPPLDD